MSNYYNDFYQNMDFRHFKQDRIYIQMLCSMLPDPGQSSVLDIGCGRGYWSRLFKECGVGRVVGIDISQTGLDIASREVPTGEFVLADAKHLQFDDNTFDMIFCQGFSEFSTPDISKAKDVGVEMLRCLKKSGMFVLAYATNLSGKTRNGWINHRKSVIVDFLSSLNCRIEKSFYFDRAIFLRLLGRNVSRKLLSDYLLPAICRVTGLPSLLVCVAKKKS